jgi:hypothetical protein
VIAPRLSAPSRDRQFSRLREIASLVGERNFAGVMKKVVIRICGKRGKLQKYGHHNAAPAHEGPSGGILRRQRCDVFNVVPCTAYRAWQEEAARAI